MKMYCPKCGSGSSYNMAKPKFCQECGESFLSAPPKQPVRNRKTVAKEIEEATPEVKEKGVVSQNINKLELDTVGTLKVKGSALGQLMGTSEDFEPYERGRSSDDNLSNEEFLEQFKKEAGTSRPAKDG